MKEMDFKDQIKYQDSLYLIYNINKAKTSHINVID